VAPVMAAHVGIKVELENSSSGVRRVMIDAIAGAQLRGSGNGGACWN
jgi:hypothetical protein